jgi:hypothetical protein
VTGSRRLCRPSKVGKAKVGTIGVHIGSDPHGSRSAEHRCRSDPTRDCDSFLHLGGPEEARIPPPGVLLFTERADPRCVHARSRVGKHPGLGEALGEESERQRSSSEWASADAADFVEQLGRVTPGTSDRGSIDATERQDLDDCHLLEHLPERLLEARRPVSCAAGQAQRESANRKLV